MRDAGGAMAGRIFVNYRRGDDPGYTQALYQKLEGEFGRNALFMDVEGHIKAGDDFVQVLDAQVAQSDVLLAVIGPRWIDARNKEGERRLDSDEDFVRIEIVSALQRGKRVIPVLVNNAAMPRAEELPEPMKPLARRNARRLTIERFAADCAGLVKDLRDLLDELEQARQAATETQRRAAEEAARRKVDEEAARGAEAQRQVEARAREQAAAGLSSEEIRKAEELANWEFVKGAANVAELRNHLARFPGGVTERYARAAVEDLTWASLGASPDPQALEAFLEEFPNGRYAAEAEARRRAIANAAADLQKAENARRLETEAWAKASTEDTREAYENFVAAWAQSEYRPAAISRVKELRGKRWRVGEVTTAIFVAVCTVPLIMLASRMVAQSISWGLWYDYGWKIFGLDFSLRDQIVTFAAAALMAAIIIWRARHASPLALTFYFVAFLEAVAVAYLVHETGVTVLVTVLTPITMIAVFVRLRSRGLLPFAAGAASAR
jgi:TIR domain-containing protein